MKIPPTNLYKQIMQQGQTGNKDNRINGKSQIPTHRDQITLSEDARLFGAALKAAREGADIRVDRVQRLKHQLQQGTYRVDSRDVASRILQGAGVLLPIDNGSKQGE